MAGGATVANKLLKIFNAAYKAEMVPLDWQKGVIRPILKKGDKTLCHHCVINHHRGIALLSHAGKTSRRENVCRWSWRIVIAGPFQNACG